MKMLAFLLKTTDRLVSRILLNGLFAAVLAAAVTLLVAYEGTRQWPPHQLTFVTMAIIAGFAAYAAGISVLLRAAGRSLVRATAAARPVAPVVGPGDDGVPTGGTGDIMDARSGAR